MLYAFISVIYAFMCYAPYVLCCSAQIYDLRLMLYGYTL
jgi:hypothetical protein